MSSEFTANIVIDGIQLKLMEGYPKFSVPFDETERITAKYLIRSSDVLALWKKCRVSTRLINGIPATIFPLQFQNLPFFAIQTEFDPYPDNLPGDPFAYNSGDSPTSGIAVAASTYTHLYTATITYGREGIVPGEPGTPPDEQDPTDVATYGVHTMSGSGQALVVTSDKIQYFKTSSAPSQDENTHAFLGDFGDKKNVVNKDTNLAKAIPIVEHSVNIPRLKNPDWDNIAGLLGTVNDNNEEHVLSHVWPRFKDAHQRPNTIMYAGFTAKPVHVIDPDTWAPEDGLPIYEVDFRFSERLVYYKGLRYS